MSVYCYEYMYMYTVVKRCEGKKSVKQDKWKGSFSSNGEQINGRRHHCSFITTHKMAYYKRMDQVPDRSKVLSYPKKWLGKSV